MFLVKNSIGPEGGRLIGEALKNHKTMISLFLGK